MKAQPVYDQSFLKREALKSAILNLVVNGAIQYFILRDKATIPLTLDSISSNETNVMGSSISLAITIAVLLTAISYLTIKAPKIPSPPTALWLTLKNGFFAFTTLTALAIAWQRLFGSIEVSLITSVMIIGIIAGIVSAIISYVTLKSIVLPKS